MSQWHPLARAPGCFTMLSHCSIQLLLASHNFLSILGYFRNPRRGQRCSSDINSLMFIIADLRANERLRFSRACGGEFLRESPSNHELSLGSSSFPDQIPENNDVSRMQSRICLRNRNFFESLLRVDERDSRGRRVSLWSSWDLLMNPRVNEHYSWKCKILNAMGKPASGESDFLSEHRFFFSLSVDRQDKFYVHLHRIPANVFIDLLPWAIRRCPYFFSNSVFVKSHLSHQGRMLIRNSRHFENGASSVHVARIQYRCHGNLNYDIYGISGKKAEEIQTNRIEYQFQMQFRCNSDASTNRERLRELLWRKLIVKYENKRRLIPPISLHLSRQISKLLA